VGRAMRHSQFFITSDGHVACKGLTLMKGYWEDEEATRSVLQDGVVTTADLGLIDDEGRLRLQGRGDDTINVGGYKVAPSEVEDVALAFHGVKDCICIPAEHPVMGTVVKLIVVPHADYDKKRLILFLKEKLEAYKVPLLYEESTVIRRTFNGKIDRKSYVTASKKA